MTWFLHKIRECASLVLAIMVTVGIVLAFLSPFILIVLAIIALWKWGL